MAKLALFLATILAVSLTCSATVESLQSQAQFENSMNMTRMTFQSLIGAIEGEENSPGSLAEKNATEIIPREVLFGTPERVGVQISPDGQWISYLTAQSGVFNVRIAPVDRISESRPITNETIRGVRSYFWAYTNHHIVYYQDTFGDENWHIYAVDITTGAKLDLTPYKNVSAYVQGVSYKLPQEILIGLNDRNPEYHDIYSVNITTGEMRLVQKNDDKFADFVVDDDLRVRFAANVTSKGDVDYLEPADNGSWEPFMKINYEDSATTYPIGFDMTGDILYISNGRGRNTAAIESLNLVTGEKEVLAEDPKADPGMMMIHPSEKIIQAVDFNYYRHNWTILDESIQPDIEYLHKVNEGDLAVTARTLDDSRWIVAFISDNGPARYYIYDRNARAAQLLFSANRQQEHLPLSRMNYTTIKSRDGLDLVSYYTLPVWADKDRDGIPEKPLPMVLLVHGGPWDRDVWGFDETHQLLSNRGYAVLSVNFRGSTGFGKNFANAGDGEWGRKMQYDLLDAVNWSIEKGIADPSEVAILGLSYGGYAVLSGMTFTPEIFACGIDICGPSNLTSFLLTIPPYWKPDIEIKFRRIGDYRTEEGRSLLRERSPLTYVDRIQKPILIAQGANDPRVNKNESGQIVQAMQEREIPVTYAFYPDEGHGLVRPGNGLSFYALTEAFLSMHLGGRYEPIGSALNGSSITVPVGADQVPGLAEALARKTS
jgi:dipeptidyl aminopeptidase/acylaminoacyl peptidase